MKVEYLLSKNFKGFVLLFLILGFPRVYGTEVPACILLLPFYGKRILNFLLLDFKIVFSLIVLSVFWIGLGFFSWSLGGGVSKDIFFHFFILAKILLNFVFGYIVYVAIKDSMKPLVCWVLVQSIIVILSVFYKSFYLFLLGFISPRSADTFQNIFGLRALGFGLYHLDGAFLFSTAVFICLVFSKFNYVSRFLLLASMFVAMLMARSAVIPYAIYSLFSSKAKVRYLFIALVNIIFLYIVFLSEYFSFGVLYESLELFRNVVVDKKLETDSTSRLFEMFLFPDNLKTFLIGDGQYFGSMQTDFYKNIDVGYLRILYFSGLGAVFLYLVLNSFFIIFSLYYKNISIFYISFLMLFVFLILNIKGIQSMPLFAFSLYVRCFYMNRLLKGKVL